MKVMKAMAENGSLSCIRNGVMASMLKAINGIAEIVISENNNK